MSPFTERLVTEFTCSSPKADLAEECLAAEEAILKFRATGEGTPELVPEQGLRAKIHAQEVKAEVIADGGTEEFAF